MHSDRHYKHPRPPYILQWSLNLDSLDTRCLRTQRHPLAQYDDDTMLTQVHDMVAADGAIVHDNVPGP